MEAQGGGRRWRAREVEENERDKWRMGLVMGR